MNMQPKTEAEIVVEILRSSVTVQQAKMLADKILAELKAKHEIDNLPRLRFPGGMSLSYRDAKPMFQYNGSGDVVRSREGDPLFTAMTQHILECHATLRQLLGTLESDAPNTIMNGECDRARELLEVSGE